MSSTGTESAEPLVGRVRRGLMWSFVNTVVVRTGSLVTGIVIARTLTREDFGTFAVALVVLSATLSFNELGTSAALLRWEGDPEEVAPTIISLSLATSALLYVACYLAAPDLARLLGAPQATGVVRLLCVAVLVDAFTAVPNARLGRAFRQGSRFVVDVVNFVVYTSVTLGLALSGAGAWSLAWGQLAGNLASAVVLLLVAPGRLRPGLDRAVLPSLMRFGFPLAGANLVLIASANLDKAAVGHLLGVSALGVYVLAFTLSSWPVNILSVTVQPIAVPGLARLLDRPDALLHAVRRGHEALLTAALFLGVPLAILSGPLVHLLYGEKWAQAAPVLRVLAISGVLRVVLSLLYDLLVAAGMTRQAFAVQSASVVALVPAIAIGAHAAGVLGVALAQLAVLVGVVLPLTLVALRPLGLRAIDLARASARPLLAGVALAAVVLTCVALQPADVTLLLLSATLGSAVFVPLAWPTWRNARIPTADAGTS